MNRRSKRPHPPEARKAEDIGHLLRCLLRVVESRRRGYTASEADYTREEYAERFVDFLDLVGHEYGPTLDLIDALIEFVVDGDSVEEITRYIGEWHWDHSDGVE